MTFAGDRSIFSDLGVRPVCYLHALLVSVGFAFQISALVRQHSFRDYRMPEWSFSSSVYDIYALQFAVFKGSSVPYLVL